MFLFSRKFRPAKIVVIRPGVTEFDVQGRIKGALDIPLTAEGSDQANQLAQQPELADLAVVYTAPSQAARETARRIADALRVKVRVDANLLNLDCGLWQGKQLSEIQRYQPCIYRQLQESPSCVHPPGGEAVTSAQIRARSMANRIRRNHVAGKIGVVVEEPMASILRSMLLNQPLEDVASHSTNYRCGQLEEIGVA